MNSIKNFVLASLLGGASCLQAQFSISWLTFDGGGGPSAGGGFSLNGTIGQPDAGAPMSGGAFTISGGFWPGVTGDMPSLSIRHGIGNTVILSWPNPSTGYVLQQTTQLASPPGAIVWTDVALAPVVNGANKEVTLPAAGQFSMFRLRRL